MKNPYFLPENSVYQPATISVSASGISKGTFSNSAIEHAIKIPKAIAAGPKIAHRVNPRRKSPATYPAA